jgi:hypothetical protein
VRILRQRCRQCHAGLLSVALATITVACSTPLYRRQPVEAAFRTERVSYDLADWGGPLTPTELAGVHDAALAEIRAAFAGMAVRFSQRHDARYAITVVQHLYDLRLRRREEVFGNARAMRGVGGRGAVNFHAVASAATAYAPEGATREDVLRAIGHGVARVAIHEITHLFLPRAPIDESADPLSYEYGHAGRREQYYGELRWGFARTALLRELGAS